MIQQKNIEEKSPWDNPHFGPPPGGITLDEADKIYRPLLQNCFEYFNGTQVKGDIFEFGTYKGYTARIISENMRKNNWEGELHLFDSFEGLPEVSSRYDLNSYEVAVNKAWREGQMKLYPDIVNAISNALEQTIGSENFIIHVGFFDKTLPKLIPNNKIALCNIDCDLYSSTFTAISYLLENDLFQDGALILFDDYNCNRAQPSMGQRKVVSELFGDDKSYYLSPFYPYGWNGQSFFVHKNLGQDGVKLDL